MGKYFRRIGICGFAAAIFWSAGLFHQIGIWEGSLKEVAVNLEKISSQTSVDQVMDAAVISFQKDLENLQNTEQAKLYLQEKIPVIRRTVNDALAELGNPQETVVRLCQEWFDAYRHDSFELTDCFYEAVHIIGENREGDS